LVEKVLNQDFHGRALNNPFGLAVDMKGNLIVSDADNDRLVRYRPDLAPDIDIGGFGSGENGFSHPTFMTFDNGLNLLVADEKNRRIARYNSQLIYVDEIQFYDSEDPLKFGYPSGVATTDYGEVWVADRDKNRIAVFNNVGQFDRFVGDYGAPGGQLSTPEKIISGKEGFLVCDAGNSRLMLYDRYGNFEKKIESNDFGYPIAAVRDSSLLWVLDGSTSEVYCLDSRNKVIFRTGPMLPGDTEGLKQPSDIVMLPSGRLAIADSGNNRIVICRIDYADE
jgi:sugar lactone lactonase YvrE